METKYPRIGTAILVVNKYDQILLSERLSKSGYGQLSVPGGKLEMFEDIKDCMERETKEECGLDLEVTILPLVTRNKTVNGNDYVCMWGIAYYEGDEEYIDFVEEDANGNPKTNGGWRFWNPEDALKQNLFSTVPTALQWYLITYKTLSINTFDCKA